jgi:hypothetical protein
VLSALRRNPGVDWRVGWDGKAEVIFFTETTLPLAPGSVRSDRRGTASGKKRAWYF